MILAAALALLLAAPPSYARTWYVTPDGTGDAPTIQAGVDSAAAGDVVLLASGTYTGVGNRAVVFHGQAVTVRSETGDPLTCILDCEGLARGFYLDSPDDGIILEGLTVTNGYRFFGGGAFVFSDCVVRNCVFSSCTGEEGGGVYVIHPATVEDCTFIDNVAYTGGGMHVAASGTLTHVTGCAGVHTTTWDAQNTHGHRVAPGTYFVRLQAGGESVVRKVVFRGE